MYQVSYLLGNNTNIKKTTGKDYPTGTKLQQDEQFFAPTTPKTIITN